MANSLDATALVNISKNRGRLLRLTEGFKGPRPTKKCLRLDPAYTGNIQHLVFGTYRTCANTPPPQEGTEECREIHKTTWREVGSLSSSGEETFRKTQSLSEKRGTERVTSWAQLKNARTNGDLVTNDPVNGPPSLPAAWECSEESPCPHEHKPLIGCKEQWDGRRNSEPRLLRAVSRSERHLKSVSSPAGMGSVPDVFQRFHSSRATDGMLHKFRRSVAIVMRVPSSRHPKEQRNSKCSSGDSGIQLESASSNDSPAILRRRALSTSEVTAFPTGDVIDDGVQTFHAPITRRQPSSCPPPIRMRSKPAPLRRRYGTEIRRSLSQPTDLEQCVTVRRSRTSEDHSSEEDFSSDESPSLLKQNVSLALEMECSSEDSRRLVAFAEALWDHVTIDAEELPFKAGQVVEVTDTGDRDWWWGSVAGRSGWFPAPFVRLRVSQEDTVEDCMIKMAQGTLTHRAPRKTSVSLLSNEQVRANIVREIVASERDFVQHLRDLVEGYLKQVLRRSDMFAPEQISAIFGNIEEIYRFQSTFLSRLEKAICWEEPQLSQIGRCFLNYEEKFKIYSEYCNNHPLAVSQLQELYADAKYIHFFEACRLLQRMIDISLDGFLLTPVQKICKYPLQLGELLKYTRPDHPDHETVARALVAMKGVAQLVNERKRRVECLEKLAEWQNSVDSWEGPEILETSSVLIYSGEVTRVTPNWSRDLCLFLFDHLLVYCKKDLLKRNTCVYKGRINVDCCCVFDVEDGKDAQFGVGVRNGWKVYCAGRDKWFLFYAKTPTEKCRWLQAFREERRHVREDREQGFRVCERDKKLARASVLSRLKPKRPRAKMVKGTSGRPHPDTAVVADNLTDLPCSKTRSGSLPSNLSPKVVVGPVAGKGKVSTSGWFHFGSGKKSKK